MTISNYFVGLIVLSAAVLSAGTVPRQSAPPSSQAQAETVTITGCLQAGEPEGTFVLTTADKQTYQVHAAEDLAAGSHVNHRVELTGIEEKTDTSLVLKATLLKMVAASCEE